MCASHWFGVHLAPEVSLGSGVSDGWPIHEKRAHTAFGERTLKKHCHDLLDLCQVLACDLCGKHPVVQVVVCEPEDDAAAGVAGEADVLI